MKGFGLHQRVMDGYTGRIGKIVKVEVVENQLMYRVKFCSYTEDFYASELKEVKQ